MGLLRFIGWNKFLDIKAVRKSLTNLYNATFEHLAEKDESKKAKYLKTINSEKKNLKAYATKAQAQYDRNGKKYEASMKKGDKAEIQRYAQKKTVLHNVITTINSSVDEINPNDDPKNIRTQFNNILSVIDSAESVLK